MIESYKGILGIVFLIGICYLLSKDRKAINWRIVGAGMGLQLIFALLVLKVPFVKKIFEVVASVFVVFLDFTKEGSKFLFGKELMENIPAHGFIFAIQVLPTVIFFSAFTSLLY
ncbi:MAG: Na+ dependent nucleoside transporter N-terminal domain-containing protein, partial [Saprospiraceae bacterium]